MIKTFACALLLVALDANALELGQWGQAWNQRGYGNYGMNRNYAPMNYNQRLFQQYNAS